MQKTAMLVYYWFCKDGLSWMLLIWKDSLRVQRSHVFQGMCPQTDRGIGGCDELLVLCSTTNAPRRFAGLEVGDRRYLLPVSSGSSGRT